MPKRGNAKLFQICVRQAREDRLADPVVAERRLIFPEA
jgi:hypothetical protein